MLSSKRRNTKKNKLEEVVKPRGFERGLQLDKIVGVTNCKDELMFLLKWHDCLEYDLVKASEVNEKCPDVSIKYYESRCPLNQKCYAKIKPGLDSPIRVKDMEPETGERKILISESVQNVTEKLLESKTLETSSDSNIDDFETNVSDTNSVQVSYSLPLIENQPGEDLMESIESTQNTGGQRSESTSSCHMPDLQDVEMQ